MSTAADFPAATKIEPVFDIDGKWYRKVNGSEGVNDPSAIRAKIVAADGTAQIKWFKPLVAPTTNGEAQE